MPELDAQGVRPPRGPGPPAPPAAGSAGRAPDPRDPGPPITVHVGGVLIGDLGNQTVDALLLDAILLRGGSVGRWLTDRGLNAHEVEATFEGARWPLHERYTVRLEP